jgi:hypothetical protein
MDQGHNGPSPSYPPPFDPPRERDAREERDARGLDPRAAHYAPTGPQGPHGSHGPHPYDPFAPQPPYGPLSHAGPYGQGGHAPYGVPAAHVPADSKAILSLVLGIVSFFTCALTAIPAVVLGFSAKGDIQRSGGLLGGGGMATAGIVTGLTSTFFAVVSGALLVLGIVTGAKSAHTSSTAPHRGGTHAPAPTLSPAGTVHAPPATIGGIRITAIDPDANETFRLQLSAEVARARAAKQSVLVMTDAKWCTVCREFEASLTDPRMQQALANVAIVRVDIEEFDAELKSLGMLETTLPWFYKVDAALRPVDAISAGEWDDNVPENMAPVLKSFVAGTLRARRMPSPMGTDL